MEDTGIAQGIKEAERIEEAVVRRLTWRLVPFLFLLYIVQ